MDHLLLLSNWFNTIHFKSEISHFEKKNSFECFTENTVSKLVLCGKMAKTVTAHYANKSS